MNEETRDNILTFLFAVVIVGALVGGIYYLKQNTNDRDDCFNNIADQLCKSGNYSSGAFVWIDGERKMTCYISPRHLGDKYNFLPEEIEECG